MYLDFYGLKKEPFQITPDPKFLFLCRRHKEAFLSLVRGIRCKKGFILMTGSIGGGKTTLCRAVLEHLGDEAKSSMILNPHLSPVQFLEAIMEDFGVEVRRKNRKGYLDALLRFLIDEYRHGSTAVIIIDEAQNLKPGTLEQIRLLSNFETNDTKLLQILMVGQPELRELLAKPSMAQIRQRVTISIALAPLDRDEMEQYIAHRIRLAGGTGMLVFDKAALDEVYRASQGIPRLVNSICDTALFMDYSSQNGDEVENFLLTRGKREQERKHPGE